MSERAITQGAPRTAAARNRVLIQPGLPQAMAPQGHQALRAAGRSMGTGWSLRAWVRPGLPAPATLVERACAEAIALFSLWDDTSAVARFNHAAPGWHRVPSDVLALLQEACAIAALTEGALDPTLGRLADLWGFGPAGPVRQPPGDGALQRARDASGLRRLRICAETRRVWQPGGLWLDFGGIAKGWAVDRASALLTAAGHGVHLVENGGEIAARGLNAQAEPWWVEVEAPPSMTGSRWLAALHGGAVAGSGDWQRRAGNPQHSWSHSLNPATGRPVGGPVVAAHVFHPRAAMADAWASALMVLPPERGLACATAAGIAALVTWRGPQGMVRQGSAPLTGWEG